MEAVSREAAKHAFQKRRSQYRAARVRLLGAAGEGRPELVQGTIEFLRDPTPPAADRDYGSVVFLDRVVTVDEGWLLFESLCNNDLPSWSRLAFRGNTTLGLPSWHSMKRTIPFAGTLRVFPWPGQVLILGLNQTPSLSFDPIVRRGLPLLEDVRSTVDEWFGFDTRRLGESHQAVTVVVPDYRARISGIVLGEKDIRVQIESGTATPNNLELRAVVRHGGERSEPPVAFVDGEYKIPSTRVADHLEVFVLDRESDEIIDWAKLDPHYGEPPRGVSFAIPEQQLIQRIEDGEDEHTEFKRQLSEPASILESIVAFANTRGGQIIVGVENDGTICGVEAEKAYPKIQDWVERYCEPVAIVNFVKTAIDGKGILVIEVPEGNDKPYIYREKGVAYVRRGATDRPAKRADYDVLYKRDSDLPPALARSRFRGLRAR